MDSNLHPIFAAIIANIEQQPAMLHRATVKADSRRFLAEPETPTGFDDLDVPRTREERAEDERYHFQEMCDADRKLEDRA